MTVVVAVGGAWCVEVEVRLLLYAAASWVPLAYALCAVNGGVGVGVGVECARRALRAPRSALHAPFQQHK